MTSVRLAGLDDGGCVVGGHVGGGEVGTQFFAMKVDRDGEEQWLRTFGRVHGGGGGGVGASKMARSADGTYFLAKSHLNANWRPYVAAMSGNFVSELTVNEDAVCRSIDVTPDGCLLATETDDESKLLWLGWKRESNSPSGIEKR